MRQTDPLHQPGMKNPLARFGRESSSLAFPINHLNQHHVVTTT
jgi:hypothetical protein